MVIVQKLYIIVILAIGKDNIFNERRLMKTNKQKHKEVDDWNAHYNVGQLVIVVRDNLSEIETVTTRPAEVLCNTAVGWFEDICGAYLLERARAI